jgi:integrase/recombinase XerD
MMEWKAYLLLHDGVYRIAVQFNYKPELVKRFKQIADARWSKTLGMWHIPDTPENRQRFELPAINIMPSIPDGVNENTRAFQSLVSDEREREQVQKFKEFLRNKRYSESTVKTYSEGLSVFLRYYKEKPLDEINNEDIILFNNYYILKKELSHSYQNQIINAIKLYFAKLRHTKVVIEMIYRPKQQKLLPNVLSKEEVKMILNAHHNLKHKAMLSLIYSCGLRCGELLNLEPAHIDSKRKVIIIKQAKGRKDRIAPLSEKIIEMLREYFIACKPEKYLFEGQKKGSKYDARSLQSVLKQALEKCKIKKPVTLHWLRHSYATHLLESGTDLRYIQEILGHTSSRTTEIYTHVSNREIQRIQSPFDSL